MRRHRNGFAGRRLAISVASVLALAGAAFAVSATAAPARRASAGSAAVRLVRIGVFAQPTYLTAPPGDRRRVFVVQRAGTIVVVVRGHRRPRPFLDISRAVNSGGSEQGLLSLAFAPDYARSGRFYVFYTDARGDVRVVRYRRSARDRNRADPASARDVITVGHDLYSNHNGGQLAFGPDGDLYIGIGDGGSEGDPSNNGQNTRVLVGKVLRIRPRPGGGYSIPRGNPFAGGRGGRPEIWAYGLRNPWRFSFDRATGALAIADVGQDREEEVDYARRGTGAGANYGWSVFEGDLRYKPGIAPHATFPVLVTRHSDGYCAIIGGYFVRDRALRALYGRYLYGDLCKPGIRSVHLGGGRATGDGDTGLSVPSLSSFGQDALGRIYAVSLDGPVYRLVAR